MFYFYLKVISLGILLSTSFSKGPNSPFSALLSEISDISLQELKLSPSTPHVTTSGVHERQMGCSFATSGRERN